MDTTGFWIEKGCKGGRWHIWTAVDAFQGDPELADVYHQDLFVPEVALSVHGNALVNETPACKSHFDHRIAAIQSQVTPQELDALRNHRIEDAFRSGQVKGYVLGIVFSDLYSGREEMAKSELHRMWPAEDEQRLWKWMLQSFRSVLKVFFPASTFRRPCMQAAEITDHHPTAWTHRNRCSLSTQNQSTTSRPFLSTRESSFRDAS